MDVCTSLSLRLTKSFSIFTFLYILCSLLFLASVTLLFFFQLCVSEVLETWCPLVYLILNGGDVFATTNSFKNRLFLNAYSTNGEYRLFGRCQNLQVDTNPESPSQSCFLIIVNNLWLGIFERVGMFPVLFLLRYMTYLVQFLPFLLFVACWKRKWKERGKILLRVPGKTVSVFCHTVTSSFIWYFLWLLSFNLLVGKCHAFCLSFAVQATTTVFFTPSWSNGYCLLQSRR